jgi:hypothetical protein
MDLACNKNDISIQIEKYMDDSGERLLSRLSNIIKKFEIYKTKRTEEDFKMEFAPIINEVANAVDVEFNPKYEKYVKSGRMDCFYGCINLEYKVPGSIEALNKYPSRRSRNIAYIEEVQRQILGCSKCDNIDKNKILGIIFDGKYIIYTYYLTTDWYISSPHKVTVDSLGDFFVKY